MVNPCYDCPKYREYGKYLDEVLITKQPDVVADLQQEKKPHKIKNRERLASDHLPVTEIDNRGNSRHVPREPSLVVNGPKKTRRLPVALASSTGICAMGGCDNPTGGAVYCKSCRVTRNHYRSKGMPVPTELTEQQKRYRETRARKDKEAAAKAAKAGKAKARKKEAPK